MEKLESYLHLPESPTGVAKKVLWYVTEDDPAKTSAIQVARRLNVRGRPPHIVFNPLDGEVVRMLEPDRLNGLFVPWVMDHNQMFSVAVVARPELVFTDFYGPHWSDLYEALRVTETPDEWPLGPPSGIPGGWRTPRREGHYSACQIAPEYPPVGRINIRRTYGPERTDA